jgi:hypothetical protein
LNDARRERDPLISEEKIDIVILTFILTAALEFYSHLEQACEIRQILRLSG